MDENDLKKYLDENQDRIKEAAVTAIMEKIKEDLRWGLPDECQVVVNTFMTEEIAPAIKDALANQKGEIVNSVIKAASQISDEIAKKMVEQAAENMSGYKAKSIIASIIAG